MFDRHDIANRYRHVLSPEDRARLPLYAALVDRLSESETAIELLGSAPVRQQNPTLILAILHYLALGGHLTLGPLYDDIRSERPVASDAFVTTVLNVVEQTPELIREHLSRSTQTNEPNRSAVLAKVIADVAHREGWSEITLIDVGCSMGLNLYPDLVTIRESDDGHDATLVTTCRSDGFIEHPVPTVTRRIGIDENPLSPHNLDDVRWLEACLWPEEPRRFRRFAALVAAAREWPEPQRLKGDARAALEDVLHTTSGPVVVLNSWVLAYLRPEERAAYRAMLDEEFARRGELAWITFEHPSMNEQLGFPPVVAPTEWAGATVVTVTTSSQPSTHWGWCHPHGHWFSLASGPKA